MSLEEAWNSNKAKEITILENSISAESPCHDCKGKNVCFKESRRCWVDVINTWGDDKITYPDPKCITK